jgi:signal transduction histidine kinase
MSSPPQSEIRHDILTSAAFRLTLRFAGIFVVCLLLLDLGIGLAARWSVEHQTKGEVEEQLSELREVFDQGSARALTETIAEIAKKLEEDGLVLGYQSADGALLAGELLIPRPEIGWSVFTPEGIDDDEALWVKMARLPDGTLLSVAAGSETYHDISELMLAGAFWTIAIAFPLALLSGALLSRTVLRRLAQIAETAEGIRDGELSRRASLLGTGDEFDRLAENLNAMLDTIESLTRNLRNVSVGISHELRSPLARIRNRLVELKGSGMAMDDAGPTIDGALAEIDGALTTFDALLRIGQIEADAQRKGFETVRFSDLVAELAEVYEPVAIERGKQFSAQVTPDVELRGNRALLTQMISNLLENAIEHTPVGTTINLELNAAAEGRRLIVRDDGPGIPPTESERIFDRFYRLEESRPRPGNGLGLSLVKSICGLHGFTVRLSPTASGAKFEISM